MVSMMLTNSRTLRIVQQKYDIACADLLELVWSWEHKDIELAPQNKCKYSEPIQCAL